jgi:hypothetical protein
MKSFLQAQRFDVWRSVGDRYRTDATPPIDRDGKKLTEKKLKAKQTMLGSLFDSMFVKVMHCDTAKDIWDKVQNIYKGYSKVKGAKIQTYRGKFEQLKMKEDEDITTYFLQVDEIINAIKGLGEEIKESIVVQKVPRFLPMIFDPKISALEERAHLSTLRMDELHGILIAYEMMTMQDNPPKKEASFKASKNTMTNKKNTKSEYNYNDDCDEDGEMAKFVRKLKKGACKYKGKLL